MTTTAMRARILAQVEPIILDTWGYPVSALPAAGLEVVPAKQPDGPLAVRTDGGALLLADPQWQDAWQELVRVLTLEQLFSILGVFELARTTLPDGVSVFGPVWYFLADRPALTPVPSGHVEELEGQPLRDLDPAVYWHCSTDTAQSRLCRPGGRPRDGVGDRLAEPGHALGDRRRCPASRARSRPRTSGSIGGGRMDSQPRPARALHDRGVQHPVHPHRPLARTAPPLDDHQARSPAIRRPAGADRQSSPRRRAASLLERLPGIASGGPLWSPRSAGGRRVPSPVATGEGEGGGPLTTNARADPSPRQRPPYPSRAR